MASSTRSTSTTSSSSVTITDPAYHTAAMSYAEWKREPTITQVLFGLQLPYRPPRSLIGTFLWRRRVWVEVTFALSMLEPWEKFLVCECSSLLTLTPTLQSRLPLPNFCSSKGRVRTAVLTPLAFVFQWLSCTSRSASCSLA